MPSTFGTALKVTVFGQSHSEAIGCVVEGFPSGFAVNMDDLNAFMARRAPGQGSWTTPRKETDVPHIVGGLNPLGATCGAPFAAVIQNTNRHSADYDNVLAVPRPGHADFTAWAKWHGNQDVPGGGHFSGRLTAPLCAAGGVALQMLAAKGVRVCAHLSQIGTARDQGFDALDNTPEGRSRLAAHMDAVGRDSVLATIDPAASEAMLAQIDAARRSLDSVGGAIECVATGLPAGVGSPMFDGMENTIARAAFGIPAVKAIEFGRGFQVAGLLGSQNNDPYQVRDGACTPVSNSSGGILGGITTGAPLLFRLAIKPTPSISRPQQSVDLATMTPAPLQVHGRHDPCVVTRAVPVVEAVCALCILDSWLAWPPEGQPFQL